MKRIIIYSPGNAKHFFNWLCIHFIQKRKYCFFLFFASVLLTGCFRHFYKVNSKEVADTTLIGQLKADNKYFILHGKDKEMGMLKLNLLKDQLEADLVALPKEHTHQMKPDLNAKNAMKAKHQVSTLKEVHLYTNTVISPDQMHINLPISAINRMDIYEMDASATRQSHILSTVGITAGTILIIGTLALIITGGLVDLP